ncbi:hypothetical protein [Spiroplasma sp. DGKH1]|uniref:hypothetical protein n=1 Tax=Spiroplasma sp. DGKH1 TaxID=3050074 RepID=UPI0034C5B22B
MKKKKIIEYSFLAFFIAMFISGVVVYLVCGRERVDIFALFVGISSLYFVFYLTYLFLKIKKNDLKKELYTGLIEPYQKRFGQVKRKKHSQQKDDDNKK